MASIRVAKRYSRSLFDKAQEENKLDRIYEDMSLLEKTLRESRDFKNALKNPFIASYKKLGILNSLFQGKVDELTLAFFKLVSNKAREDVLQSIAQSFRVLYYSFKGIQEATVTTTITLSDKQSKAFEEVVKKATGAVEVHLTQKVNEAIVGGYILRIGDRQIDDSLKSRLEDIQKELI